MFVKPIQYPMIMECGKCGGELRVYPYPAPTGSGFCTNCSPKWLESFLQFATLASAGRGFARRT